jgi:3-oxoacid CoA-transferase subunit A
VLEEALRADVALVRAWKGDRHGNLVFRRAARNFNPLCAMAARRTVAEVEHLVAPGDLDPRPGPSAGIYVDGVLPMEPGQVSAKAIERRTVRTRGNGHGLDT